MKKLVVGSINSFTLARIYNHEWSKDFSGQMSALSLIV